MTYNLIEYPRFRHIDPSTGLVAAGWKVYTYKAGTSTEQATYTDKELVTPNTNPIILDSNGEAVIYTGVPLKIVLKDTTNVTKWTQDYLAYEQDVIIRATEDAITNNLYEVTSIPAQTSLVDNIMIIWQPSADNSDTIVSTVFTGTGINDCNFYGPYTGSTSGSTFEVVIDSTGSPDTFKWRKDSEAYTTLVAITGGLQSLKEGVSVIFSRTTGHTATDLWTLTTERPPRIDLDGLGAKLIYKNVGGVLQALDGGDLKANYPSIIAYSETSDAFILSNPQAPDLTPTAITIDRPRRSIDADHSVTTADNGYELSFTGTRTITLPAAASFPNNFVYITNGGTGTLTINADGTEKIYWPFDTTGKSTVLMQQGGYHCIQLASNSVDWHVLTATTLYHGISRYVSGSGSWVCPDNVKIIYVSASAGGGGGGGAYALGSGACNAAGGGGSGQGVIKAPYTVTPGTSYPYAVGAGGSAGSGLNNGSAGGATYITGLFSLSGGAGGGHSGGLFVNSSFSLGRDGGGGLWGSPGPGGLKMSAGTSQGSAGQGYGGGGGGAAVWDTLTGSTAAGGGGAGGFLIIEW